MCVSDNWTNNKNYAYFANTQDSRLLVFSNEQNFDNYRFIPI